MSKYATSGEFKFSDRKGLHQTEAVWWIETGIEGFSFRLIDRDKKLAEMDSVGRLTVFPGYLHDGSSGPTVDGPADPVPSLVHDVFYEAMRVRALPQSLRQKADAIYRQLLQERGMGAPRAWLRYIGLRIVGGPSASPREGGEYVRRSAR